MKRLFVTYLITLFRRTLISGNLKLRPLAVSERVSSLANIALSLALANKTYPIRLVRLCGWQTVSSLHLLSDTDLTPIRSCFVQCLFEHFSNVYAPGRDISVSKQSTSEQVLDTRFFCLRH